MSATKKVNQSRPRRLLCDGPPITSRAVPACRSRTYARPSRRLLVYGWRRTSPIVDLAHEHRLARPVLRRQPQLLPGHVEDHALALVENLEPEHRPFDRDPTGADAEEAAELDHGRPHLAVAVGQDVDDPARVFVPGPDLP